jgi:hypothetical protein
MLSVGRESGVSALSALIGLGFGCDNIGRLGAMDWDASPSVSGMTTLADHGGVGGACGSGARCSTILLLQARPE